MEDVYLQEIYRQLKGDFFVFDKLLHYKIFRPGKKPRDIQAPTVRDRIVQKIINSFVMLKYFSRQFAGAGIVGSVRGNSLRKILGRVLSYYNDGYVFVLKTDIINYFPSIDRQRLVRVIAQHVKDKTDRKFLYNYLKVTELPGIPQGPPLSPLMANIYLLALDKYLEKKKEHKAHKICR